MRLELCILRFSTFLGFGEMLSYAEIFDNGLRCSLSHVQVEEIDWENFLSSRSSKL